VMIDGWNEVALPTLRRTDWLLFSLLAGEVFNPEVEVI